MFPMWVRKKDYKLIEDLNNGAGFYDPTHQSDIENIDPDTGKIRKPDYHKIFYFTKL